MDNFKFLGNYNIENWLNKLNTLTDEDWSVYTFRQDLFEVHSETKTIPILFDESYSAFMGRRSVFYGLFKDDVDELNSFYNSVVGEGDIIRIEIVKMPAHTEVPPHLDYGASLELHSRTHIPLQTNEGCVFTVGDDSKYLKVGEVWEIDNGGKVHGVVNNSDIDRIHMIVDFKHNIVNKLF